jgi:hypothetical protein
MALLKQKVHKIGGNPSPGTSVGGATENRIVTGYISREGKFAPGHNGGDRGHIIIPIFDGGFSDALIIRDPLIEGPDAGVSIEELLEGIIGDTGETEDFRLRSDLEDLKGTEANIDVMPILIRYTAEILWRIDKDVSNTRKIWDQS